MSGDQATEGVLAPTRRRQAFRAGLSSGRIQRYVGAFTPLSVPLIEQAGFEGVYISGSVLAAERGLPDIGLTTASEVIDRGQEIAGMTSLPAMIDADTGFGEPSNVARTITGLERAGLAGAHLEDQVNPKRCGHLDGKQVVSTEEMLRRVRAAVVARTDPEFVLCARTDARAVEGFDAALDRARAYADAGADLIFPEALKDLSEFEAFAQATMAAGPVGLARHAVADAAALAGAKTPTHGSGRLADDPLAGPRRPRPTGDLAVAAAAIPRRREKIGPHRKWERNTKFRTKRETPSVRAS